MVAYEGSSTEGQCIRGKSSSTENKDVYEDTFSA